MNMNEATNRLRLLAESFHAKRVETVNGDGRHISTGYIVTTTELEAVTVAAAILGMFVEALEDTTT